MPPPPDPPSDSTAAPAEGQLDTVTRVEMDVQPAEATVGELLQATLTLTLAADARLEPQNLGPTLGPFSVADGAWSGPETTEEGVRWVWTGHLSAFRTGEQEVPPVTLSILRDSATLSVSSDPVTITINSVLAPEELGEGEDEPELADLKPPVSVAPDYGPLKAAVGVLVLLLLASIVAWWLHKRYAARLAAAEVPEDPFHRIPPHVWVYGALQKLLERRLPEEGRIDEFYSELSHILKRYLSGRYRVELLEQTTEEISPTLRQAGAPENSIHDTEDLLREADGVKFAKERPGATEWKAGVEGVYRIVDRTKPVEVVSEERGVA